MLQNRKKIVLVILCITIVVLHYFWVDSIVRRFSPWIYWALYTSIVSIGIYLLRNKLVTLSRTSALLIGTLIGYMAGFILYPVLELLLINNAYESFISSLESNPSELLVGLTGFPIFLGVWIVGALLFVTYREISQD
jgi:hypothetical protein